MASSCSFNIKTINLILAWLRLKYHIQLKCQQEDVPTVVGGLMAAPSVHSLRYLLNWGDTIYARKYWAQCREMMLLVLTHNIAVLLFVNELFYRACLTPLILPAKAGKFPCRANCFTRVRVAGGMSFLRRMVSENWTIRPMVTKEMGNSTSQTNGPPSTKNRWK